MNGAFRNAQNVNEKNTIIKATEPCNLLSPHTDLFTAFLHLLSIIY